MILPGETASESTVFGVQEGDGVGVAGIPPTDAEQEGNRRDNIWVPWPPAENHAPIRWIYQPRGGEELPRRGVLGTGGDEDGNVGTLFTPVCP